jgi:uncharacterized membrane protein
MNPAALMRVGFALTFLGFAVVVVGALLGAGGSGSFGGFILIGPFPIVFGSGPDSGFLAIVAVAITGLVVAAYLVSLLLWRSSRRGETGRGEESE